QISGCLQQSPFEQSWIDEGDKVPLCPRELKSALSFAIDPDTCDPTWTVMTELMVPVQSLQSRGAAGNTVYDPGSGHMLVAVHEKNERVAIEPATAKIIARYPVPGIESPHGIALDVNARLAFVAGEENNKLAMVDLTNVKVLATCP